MRCASKAAESASARLCADAEAGTAATDVSSVAEANQPVSLGDAGAGHEDTHVFTEYELGVSYSPDMEDGSVSTAIESKPPAKRGMDDALRRSIFGSSDESDEPSPKRRRSRSRDSGANSGVGSPMDTIFATRCQYFCRHIAGREGPQCLASRSREEGMDASQIRHGSLVGDVE
uniref:Uncharacterized protein n=1 Tax=Peronospora matthiolae TaxID=2874970 RepID=A0AAV1UDE6_9STRA